MAKSKKLKKDKSKDIENCPICERPMGQDRFGCEKCGQLVCEGCFDNDSDRCVDCKQ